MGNNQDDRKVMGDNQNDGKSIWIIWLNVINLIVAAFGSIILNYKILSLILGIISCIVLVAILQEHSKRRGAIIGVLLSIILMGSMIYDQYRKDEESVPITTSVIGDVDGDGSINATDAQAILKHAAGVSQLEGEAKRFADVNGDDAINAMDAFDVLRKVAGVIDKFEAEAKE